MWNLLLPAVTPIIDKLVGLIPNANERARAREEFEKQLADAVNAQTLAQLEVNKAEAAHRSAFVASWRPCVGYVCAIGLAWAYVMQPIINWLFFAFLPELPPPPTINVDGLYQLVLAMLGMGGLRTFEKVKGVTK